MEHPDFLSFLDTIRIALFVAMLNGLKVCAADISSAYLTAFTSELKWTILGPEFGPEWAGKKVKIDKALYGLIGSCSSFHRSLCVELYKLGSSHRKPTQIFGYERLEITTNTLESTVMTSW